MLPNQGHLADSLSLEHLRAFIAFVETGTQAGAAARLRIGQATVSRHIERVQQHFGGGLFQGGTRLPLSTRGEIVAHSIRSVLSELSRTRDRLADRPVLRIGFIRPVRALVERALRRQAQGMLAFDVRLLELSSEKQAHKLGRELDIAICYAIDDLFAGRDDVEASLVTEEPFALAIPEQTWVGSKISIRALEPLHYVHLPRRFFREVVKSGRTWLDQNGLQPERTIECALATEIMAYASAGCGYGFLPALWSLANHEGVVFARVPDLTMTARIAAYSLKHVQVTQLRRDLSTAARSALADFRGK